MSKTDLYTEPDPSKTKIYPRVGLDDEGRITLFDAITGREMSGVTRVELDQPEKDQDLQTVRLTFFTDSRIVVPRARKAIDEGGDVEANY